MKEKLIIIGASGHGKVVADIAVKMNAWETIEFLDDNEEIEDCLGFKVVGKPRDALRYKGEADFFVAIGNNGTREKVQKSLEEQEINIATLIHPSAIIGMDVKVETGTVVMAGVVINSSTSIGKGCIINTSSSIDHDNIIGDYIHISPGVNMAGSVSVGKRSWLGIGAKVSNNIGICSDCIVGAGAVVTKDIDILGVYVGVPARRTS